MSDLLIMASLCGMSVSEAKRCRIGFIFEMFNARFRRKEV